MSVAMAIFMAWALSMLDVACWLALGFLLKDDNATEVFFSLNGSKIFNCKKLVFDVIALLVLPSKHSG